MKSRTLTLYIDGVDWQHELGEASGGNYVYYSKRDILATSACADTCGVVRVKATLSNPTWVHRQDLKYRKETPASARAHIAAHEAKLKALLREVKSQRKILAAEKKRLRKILKDE